MNVQESTYWFDVITLFPSFFAAPLTTGLLGRAIREDKAGVRYIDPRDFTRDRHRTVDDAPYGGGAGMVMKADPLLQSVEVLRTRGPGPVVLLSPQGRQLAQSDLVRWADGQHLGLICGRYEGFDERVRTSVDEEVSLGDFVLTGGEYAALAVVDGVVRLRPGTLGNAASVSSDSFSDNLLEYPQYTRPEVYGERVVPSVLLGGDHKRVAAWRYEQQLRRTRLRRPDLLEGVWLGGEGVGTQNPASMGQRVRLSVAVDTEDALSLNRLRALASAYAIESVDFVPRDAGWADLQDLRSFESSRVGVVIPVDRQEGVYQRSESWPSPVVKGPRVLRRLIQEGRTLHLWIGIQLDPALMSEMYVLPPPRQLGEKLDPVSRVAVVLDRILSEG